MIEHFGVIEKIEGTDILVRITQKSACSDCHAKGVCMSADKKEKIVNVKDYTGNYKLNEQVIIVGQKSVGYLAILWAFVAPLVILLSVIILLTLVFNMEETEAALTSLTTLIPYYIALYLLRNKMAKQFTFTIKKIY